MVQRNLLVIVLINIVIKKAGLFDFGFHRKGQNAIARAKRMQNTTLDITDTGKSD